MPKPRPSSAKAATLPPRRSEAKSPLLPLGEFGANPGSLKMLAFAPGALPPKSPLVVVLHGLYPDRRRL